jgi:hypothetical protein
MANKAALSQPPHPLHGHYLDSTGKKYWVSNKPKFFLFRCTDDWGLLDPDSPTQDDAEHFQRQLDYHTFTRINH